MSTRHYPRPSAGARELVRGAYDLHVHTSPDVMPRSATDLELAYRCREVGLAGFVIKSHYVPTAERAALVRSVVPGVHALGAITLNSAVGGMNTLAVEVAAREGARIVWMPTFDALNEMSGHHALPPGAQPPQWARLQRERGTTKTSVGTINEPIVMGGTSIAPGDIVLLDADGAVVVAAQQAERVLEASQARQAREAEFRQALQSGALTYDLHGLRPLVERPEEH